MRWPEVGSAETPGPPSALEKALARIAPVVKEGEGSPIRKIKSLMEARPDMLSLAMGEANFPPPEELLDAAVRALRGGRNLYTSTNGIPAVREAVARFAARWWDADLDPERHVLMTVGGMEALHLAARILVSPGDRVLLPDPGWGMTRVVHERLGAELEFYPLRRDPAWSIDVDAILERLDPGVKVVAVNSPSNPTGAVLSREGWSRLLEATREMGVFVLSDEVYHNYAYSEPYTSSLAFGPPENVVVVQSFSKTFAVTGWRLGYAVAHPDVLRQMATYKESISLCSFSVGQFALAEYLDHSDPYLAWANDLCRGNMERVVERLDGLPGVRCAMPEGGFYAFPDLSEIEPSCQLQTERLLTGGVAVVPGGFFGGEGVGCLRVGIAAPYEQIAPALDRFEERVVAWHQA